MKNRLPFFLVLGALMFWGIPRTQASHIVGVDLSYSCQDSCTIRLELRAYRDCSGSSAITNLVNFVPQTSGCGQPVALSAWSPQATMEVTPICPGMYPTTCDTISGPFMGIEEFYFFRDYDICGQPNCIYTLEWGTCCRNAVITSGSSNQGIGISSTTLNTNLTPCNNSPQFSAPPFFRICAGNPFVISQNASDPDGDSLSYSLGPCYTDNNTQVNYAAGYSPSQPLGSTWNVTMNSVSGDITLVPQPGNTVAGVLCVQIEEWRGGNLINTIVRDFQVVVMNCPAAFCGTNLMEGNVFRDNNSNCLSDAGDQALGGWQVMLNPGGFIWPANGNGDYRFYLPPGSYTVSTIPPPNGLWQTTCPPTGSYTVNFIGQSDTSSGNDFGNEPLVYCPSMWVDIGNSLIRPCVPTVYYVSWANTGTDTAYSSTVEVTLDSNITYTASSAPLIGTSGNMYTFSLGDVAPGEYGNFSITGAVACDTSIVGDFFCAEAHIYPDSFCLPPDSTWDNSSVQVTGQCINDSLLCFTVTNTGAAGSGDMQGPTDWRVYENGTQTSSGTLQLCGGCDTVLCFTGNGNTIRFEVDQRPGHPGNSLPSATIENCGSPNSAFGLVNVLPQDDGDLFISIDCQAVVNSFDPNSKRVTPSGVDPQYHYVDSTVILEYFIDFQNTGNADALEVVIEDSLDARLDLSTLTVGVSSHAYTWEVASGRRLRFTFSNINLPPESQDSLGSIGFVKFYIQLLPGLTAGDRIENTADIYFDINAPIRTNTVFNTVGWPVVTAADFGPATMDVRLYPNPTTNQVFAEVMGLEAGTPLAFELYSVMGQKVYSGSFEAGNRYQIDLDRMPRGVYIYRISGSGRMIHAGKLVKQ